MSESAVMARTILSYLRSKAANASCSDCLNPEWEAANLIEALIQENNNLKKQIEYYAHVIVTVPEDP
jgi:hypothetical protein